MPRVPDFQSWLSPVHVLPIAFLSQRQPLHMRARGCRPYRISSTYTASPPLLAAGGGAYCHGHTRVLRSSLTAGASRWRSLPWTSRASIRRRRAAMGVSAPESAHQSDAAATRVRRRRGGSRCCNKGEAAHGGIGAAATSNRRFCERRPPVLPLVGGVAARRCGRCYKRWWRCYQRWPPGRCCYQWY
jgi:hypothetical protein